VGNLEDLVTKQHLARATTESKACAGSNRQSVWHMKQPEIKAALIRALEDEMDSPLAAFGYHRPPKGLVYSRREGGVKCQFAFEFASNPSYAVGAIAHLTPTLRTANAQILALALQLTEDPWLLANAPDVIQNQRLTLVAKPHMPEWYLANSSQVRDVTEGILGKFIERGRAFLEDYSTPGGIVSQYEAGDSRGLFQQHYHVYVIAASLLEGRADVAKTILEDKFSKPGVKKRFEAFWRNVNA
jgi:hypothetical protein